MNLFVAWKMNTQYLRLYILGYEPFCCVEDEYTLFMLLYLRSGTFLLCGS